MGDFMKISFGFLMVSEAADGDSGKKNNESVEMIEISGIEKLGLPWEEKVSLCLSEAGIHNLVRYFCGSLPELCNGKDQFFFREGIYFIYSLSYNGTLRKIKNRSESIRENFYRNIAGLLIANIENALSLYGKNAVIIIG
jgi:hypothetical protein